MYLQRNIEARSRSLSPWKGNITYLRVCARVRVRACSLPYPACILYAPYCDAILWPLWLHHIFRHYLINGTIFGKRFEHNNVFWFSIQLLCNIFLTVRRI
jgi:hypothetical protein